ncbi:MAG: site-2 protease family protein [Actinobacteria bacterium]|nr:site-2 protease family protein [Actinomycetota bacterium]
MGGFRVGIGRMLGVRVFLHLSWFPVYAAFTLLVAHEFGLAYPGLGRGVRLGMGAACGLLFFGSLLAHELAHAVVARRRGVAVRGITLFMFGGVAEIGGEARTPADEFAIALVGPATSLFLGGVFAVASFLAGLARLDPVEGVVTVAAVANVVVALFNLVPGLPLDGGRLLRAGVWRVTGSRRRATRVASAGGAAVSAALTALGLWLLVTGRWAGAWYVLVGWFLGTLALRSLAPARDRRAGVALGTGEGQAAEPRP